MSSKSFVKRLGEEDKDRLRVEIETEKGKVVNFVVQYEALIQAKWHAIVRYDCSHGFAHRDVMHIDGSKDKTTLSITNLGMALLYAEQDIKDRWDWYKERYEKELRKKWKGRR